jgi:hypothetical protein
MIGLHRLLLGCALVLVGCNTAPETGRTALTFELDSAQEYIPGTPYERRWVPASDSFTGALIVSSTAFSLLAQDTTFVEELAGSSLSLPLGADDTLYLLQTPHDLCHSFTLAIAQGGSALSGTYWQLHDCHGRSSVGRFHGSE